MMGDAQSLRSWPAHTLAYRLVLWVCFRAPPLCCAAGITTDQLLKIKTRCGKLCSIIKCPRAGHRCFNSPCGGKNNQRSWKERRNRVKQRSTAGGGGRGRLTSAGRAVTGSCPPPELGEPSKGCFRQITAAGGQQKLCSSEPRSNF